MKCPYCGDDNDRVIDTRLVKDGEAIRRRRECLSCGRRFTTYEYIEKTPLLVIKKDGRREPFERDKILQGILTACHKRPIPREKIENLVDEVVSVVSDLGTNEVESRIIGEEIMKRLKKLDDISYVRFASVYREFRDKKEFMKELKNLKG
ncbi:transcriptional regulator NrdR [bacterium]|uniref:Transcriptional repressor NrdR n=1 Tax=candidate division WOR-3 bacterium TaxID=2052148 RepID=A0A7C0ZAP9_UNCW3|nr:MAG: transcriptional regulator NrdR [bacterium]RKZ23407.1 MAG: transcriptional regulator NrdR [bacterium]HDI83730.1 transcriptional repressor NrdR [candidate division WOR-3 bacterium]